LNLLESETENVFYGNMWNPWKQLLSLLFCISLELQTCSDPCGAQVAIRDELRRTNGDIAAAESVKAYVSG
jgi:hypothetical protein